MAIRDDPPVAVLIVCYKCARGRKGCLWFLLPLPCCAAAAAVVLPLRVGGGRVARGWRASAPAPHPLAGRGG